MSSRARTSPARSTAQPVEGCGQPVRPAPAAQRPRTQLRELDHTRAGRAPPPWSASARSWSSAVVRAAPPAGRVDEQPPRELAVLEHVERPASGSAATAPSHAPQSVVRRAVGGGEQVPTGASCRKSGPEPSPPAAVPPVEQLAQLGAGRVGGGELVATEALRQGARRVEARATIRDSDVEASSRRPRGAEVRSRARRSARRWWACRPSGGSRCVIPRTVFLRHPEVVAARRPSSSAGHREVARVGPRPP